MAAPALRAVSSLTDDEQTNVLGATLGVGFGLSPSLYQSVSEDFSRGFFKMDAPWVSAYFVQEKQVRIFS
jgi:hypothetical protein